ncbi:putative late blight resistance proteinR1B-16 [Sesamum alatum]|uniref:Late blight resistance proteinR1B-16 n=1 Tax=Sesamum alatum TaxID=300844 RepID=A0AAE1YMK8_9LAMI|nr:putative late blight resistance proteinR1B-16 [Sesamum alatum]
MAYAALISVQLSLWRLLSSTHTSSTLPAREQIKKLAREVLSLQELLPLKGSNNKRVNALERQIREAIFRLEDVVESAHLSSYQLNRLSGKNVKKEIRFFTQSVKKILEEYRREERLLPEEDDSSRIDDFDGKESKMVGLEDEISEIKTMLIHQLPCKRQVVAIKGMAGIGKTALARQIYEHPSISSIFECRVWVRIGTKYRLKEIMLEILAKLNLENIDEIYEKGHEELGRYVSGSLQDRRYLIVVDDIWSPEAWNEIESLFPDNKLGSRILLTTRIDYVATYTSHHSITKRFLKKEESWHLLRGTVFAEEDSCPPQLEEVGKKIAEKCEGLPLAIIGVGKHLSEAEKLLEYWNKVAGEEISAIIAADDVMSKKLMLSYKHLRQDLKACFLYMGVFPHGYEIPASKVIKMWCAEGFIKQYPDVILEDLAVRCLQELAESNVVLICESSSSGAVKTCKVHLVFWHLCTREAVKDEFFHVMNSNANQGIENQRGLCIHNNILFSIKDVRNSMASVPNARSLLCTGPHHEYPIPKYLGFSLLRVLDALTIRFYEFPLDVLKLIYLRYLAITYNGKLPASISKLQNLQYLIVRQYLSILSSGSRRPYLPMEIWDMKELRHLHAMGSDLPDPSSDGALLPNLLTLLGISARSCTKKVFEKIPNLKKLGIQIELALDAAVGPLCCFDHLSHLDKLQSFKYVIVNPKAVAPPPLPILNFKLLLLWKVTLSGLQYPWEYASNFKELPYLQVLKLRCHAFQGPVWETYKFQFPILTFLLLEDVDLESWHADDDCFPMLKRLSIRHCYKLKRIPSGFVKLPTLRMIELVDCDPSLVASAQKIQDIQRGFGHDFLEICVESSEDDGKSKS